jgi:polysaccharide deacetylase 2 family uncharacterized protein YibQ
MNRAARRRQQRQNSQATKTYFMSENQVTELTQKIMEEALAKTRMEAMKYSADCIISAFTIALHDMEGFGVKRLKRVLEKVNTTFECINYEGSELTLDDLKAMCKEIGIEVT